MDRGEAPVAVSALRLWIVLSRCCGATQTFVEETIASERLGFSEFMVLEVLLHKGALPISVIGQKILRTNASMTSVVDRLEARRLVRREPSREDRRVSLIELTAAGRKLIQAVFKEHEAQMENLMEGLTQGERAAMYAGLRKLGLEAAARKANR